MATVPNASEDTDLDIAASLARIDRAIAAIEASRDELARMRDEAMTAARARRDISDMVSAIIAITWLVSTIGLAIYGAISALGGVR